MYTNNYYCHVGRIFKIPLTNGDLLGDVNKNRNFQKPALKILTEASRNIIDGFDLCLQTIINNE